MTNWTPPTPRPAAGPKPARADLSGSPQRARPPVAAAEAALSTAMDRAWASLSSCSSCCGVLAAALPLPLPSPPNAGTRAAAVAGGSSQRRHAVSSTQAPRPGTSSITQETRMCGSLEAAAAAAHGHGEGGHTGQGGGLGAFGSSVVAQGGRRQLAGQGSGQRQRSAALTTTHTAGAPGPAPAAAARRRSRAGTLQSTVGRRGIIPAGSGGEQWASACREQLGRGLSKSGAERMRRRESEDEAAADSDGACAPPTPSHPTHLRPAA